MLMEPTQTAFDLRWRMLGIGVRVHPTFWLFSVFMGWGFAQQKGIWFLLIWVAAMFVSVLVHELGHACAARLFGCPANIVLYMMGGLAIGPFNQARSWQRMIIILAGPLAGFALYGLVIVLDRYWFTETFHVARFDPPFDYAIRFFKYFNLMWSCLNLIPVLPLDGGQLMQEVCTALAPRRGFIWALNVSLVAAGLIVFYCVLALMRNRPESPPEERLFWPRFTEIVSMPDGGLSPLFALLFFGLLAVQNFMALQQARRDERGGEEEDDVDDFRGR